MFFIFPSLTNPSAFYVVTNASQAYAFVLESENDPIDQILGIDIPA